MRNLLIVAAAYALSASALAAQMPVQSYVSSPQKVGEARMQYLFWDVYDAALYAPKGEWDWQVPFALQLSYLMDLSGEDIAKRSAEEMRKIGLSDEMKLAAWYSQMKALFPDVKEGERLTGIFRPHDTTIFYYGEKRIGEIRDPEFARWFAGIWLNEKTSQPQLRRQLLGMR